MVLIQRSMAECTCTWRDNGSVQSMVCARLLVTNKNVNNQHQPVDRAPIILLWRADGVSMRRKRATGGGVE